MEDKRELIVEPLEKTIDVQEDKDPNKFYDLERGEIESASNVYRELSKIVKDPETRKHFANQAEKLGAKAESLENRKPELLKE